MEDRRCLYCGRKIHPKLRPDAKFCGRSCKSSYHRDKKQTGKPGPDEQAVPLSSVYSSLARTVQSAAPPGALGYVLRKHGCPLGNGTFDFPVPTRKTKHTDGTLRNSTTYRLWPFEPPRIPWNGAYELLFWVPERGLIPSEDPQQREIHLGKVATVPRAAFDEHALWSWIPPIDDSDAGSAEYLRREVLARAPAGAIGYALRISGTPLGPCSFFFPPRGRISRRADRSLSDVPYYCLEPFELPCVPWAGNYTLSYELEHRIVYFSPDPAQQLIRVGVIFPYADCDKPPHVPSPSRTPLGASQPPLLLIGAPRPRRVLRKLSAGTK